MPADLLVDTGQSLECSFAPTNHYGDWVTAEIQFSGPFLVEPVVLLTARVPTFGGFGSPGTGTVAAGCAPVAIAQNVTRFGFTLAARNSDTNGNGGVAFFDWVAFGLWLGAPNCHVERVFNPDRKDPHWGRRKLARDR